MQNANTPPDIAIVDLGMPSGSGLDVIRHLKQLQSEAVHVIVLTGRDYPMKPLPDLALLEIAVRRALEIRLLRDG